MRMFWPATYLYVPWRRTCNPHSEKGVSPHSCSELTALQGFAIGKRDISVWCYLFDVKQYS
jgi:hypothetical protein